MGLLDDAIREHLDLKRRRGADPAEVARLEQEALGPVRREPAASEPAPAEAAAADERRDEPPAEAPPAPHAAEHHPHPVDEGLHPDERTHVLAPEDRHEPPHGDPLFDHPAHDAPEPDGPAAQPQPQPEAAEPAEPQARSRGAHADVDQPTTEYRVEDHHDDEHHEPHQGEDVLEETPDFLQETPEHDRLWFEQRPPRDFDFDG